MIINKRNGIILKIAILYVLISGCVISFAQSPNHRIDTAQISLLIKKGDSISTLPNGSRQNALKYYQDALLLSNQLHNTSFTNNALLKLSVYYAAIGDLKKCRNLYEQVLNFYRNKHDLLSEKKTISFILTKLYSINNAGPAINDEKIFCLERKRVVNTELKDIPASIDDLKEIGNIHLNEGKLDLAENELLKALGEFQAIHFKNIHDTYFLLGAVSHLKGNQQKELYYYTETVKGMLATNDTTAAIWFYYKLAHIYKDLGQYDKSLIYFQKSTNSAKARKMPFGGTLLQVVEVMIAQGRAAQALIYFQNQLKFLSDSYADKYVMNQGFADCYIALKQNKKAEYYLLGMIANQLPFYQTKGQTAEMHLRDYKQVCSFYISVKNYSKAKYFLDKAVALSKENVSALSLSNLELLNFQVDSAFGNYISAIKHYQNHKRLTDSIFNATKSKQIADLQIHYELAQKDKNILLLKKQSIIEKDRLKQRKIVGNILIAGLILLLALLALLYSRYRLRQRNIMILQESQKEISSKNQSLEKLLHDNEWLLKEVHHRVKNNLQIVMSLLQSQTIYLKDEGALNAVLDSQHRVQTMSLIHQKLYKSADASSVYMAEYIGELVDYLKESFKTGLRIIFKLEIEPIVLDVMQAVPVGLILNEIITNSIKYAFPFSEKDEINIRLTIVNNNEIQLSVSDNGRGLPGNFDIDQVDSFGLILIKGLIDDLSGTFLLQRNSGTTIILRFNINQLAGEAPGSGGHLK